MSTYIESSGDIEVLCFPSGRAIPRNAIPFFSEVGIGDRLCLIFNPSDANPPYSLKIVSPTGTTIVDTILRDLPTALPQSAAPVEFMVSVNGVYKITIGELKGRQRGEARVKVG